MKDLHCGNMTKDHEQQPKQLYTPLYFEASGATAENTNDLIHDDVSYLL